MSDRTITHLSPASDLAQDLGRPGNRWRNGYFENLSDGAGSVTPAAIAGHLAFMSGKGAVTPALTIYVRADGNDSRDGLTAATAVRTPSRAVELVNTRHAGLAADLTLNFGAGEFTDDWSPADIDVGPDFFTVHGAGIDATVFATVRRWSVAAAGTRYRGLENFTLRRMPGGDSSPTLTFGAGVCNSLSGVGLDHSRLASPLAGFSLAVGSATTYIRAETRFDGKFTTCVHGETNFNQTLYLGGAAKFVFAAGSTYARLFRLPYGQKMFIATSSPANHPVYNGTAPSEHFASLAYGSEIIFRDAAARDAWLGDWTYSADASSRVRLASEA